MKQQLRTLALVLGGALVLSACGLIGNLIPEQEVPDGLLGADGEQVTLSSAAVPGGDPVGPNAPGDVNTFEADVDLPPVELAPLDVPGFIQAQDIVETLTLENSVQVVFDGTFAGPGDLHPDHLDFTLSVLAVSGSVAIAGNDYTLDTVTVGDLGVVFEDPSGFETEDGSTSVTYTTTSSNLPEVEFDLGENSALLSALSQVLRDGGEIAASLRIVATLASEGLPPSAQIVVTLDSLGATIRF